jgi:alpha-amylase
MSRPGMTTRRAVTVLMSTALTASLVTLPGISAAGAQSDHPDRSGPASGDGAQHALRSGVTDENFYFVMADRFANGDTGNDLGGLPADPMVSGFDPTNKGFYQGGDLEGIRSQLDYIEGLGTTSIWLTPSFKNKAVQVEDSSAGYHGYWITDFTQIDPHLGSNDDLAALVDEAHGRGMKVYFDIITNHTADVIGYESAPREGYVSKDAVPYKAADGTPFDDRDFAGTDDFPELDPQVSFPYVPVLEPGEEDLKVPAWLNDPTLYHNRGNTSFVGEDSLYGDFFGLDDLFTENPRVVDGMIDIYETWIADFGVDGFRIDTMKHVDDAFWQRFGPEVLQFAHEQGKDEFFMFGEVFDTSRPFTSSFTTRDRMQAVLDFPFQAAARGFASQGASASSLEDFFAADDWYTDADSNVYSLPTFLGNHDMGRIGQMIQADNPGAGDAEWVARDRLAHELMYFSRGNPVIYYGDEQGFTGTGGDQLARQTLFASQVPEYLDDDLLGTDATHATSNFNPSHVLYRTIGELARVTEKYPALRDGAHQNRYASDGPGVYAFSRIDADQQREFLVALNNSEQEQTVTVPTWVGRSSFRQVYGDSDERLRSTRDGDLTVTVPALSAVVYRSSGKVERSRVAPAVTLVPPTVSEESGSRVHLAAEVAGDSFYEVTFEARVAGGDWTSIGTDDTAPYQVFHDVSGLTTGAAVEYRASVLDNRGNSRTSASATATVPAPRLTIAVPAEGALVRRTVDVQAFADPERGSHVVTLERRIGEGEWTALRTDDSSPAYTVRDDISAIADGTTLQYRAVMTDGGVTSTSAVRTVTVGLPPQPVSVTFAGSFDSELGCTEDWQPSCVNAQATFDPVAGVWTLTADLSPDPSGAPYEYKAALNGTWDVNYGAGGAFNGANVRLELTGPSTVTFTYDHTTHLISHEVVPAG